jgi:hypothetical protein
MSQSDITAPILSYDDINNRAEDFLQEHRRNDILPVDIEAIAEFDLSVPFGDGGNPSPSGEVYFAIGCKTLSLLPP